MQTYSEYLAWARHELSASPSPHLDAEVLLCFAAGLTKPGLIAALPDPVNAEVAGRYRAFIARRREHEPAAYITGVKEFWGLEFRVTPQVLIPRPETELLVEKTAEFCRSVSDSIKLLDLGTGSGCIAVALACELSKAGRGYSITAVDQSAGALEVAKMNAVGNRVSDLFEFKRSDWFAGLEGRQFHAVACNPPYIGLAESDLSPELRFEPAAALFAGNRGTEAVEYILSRVGDYLFPGGAFFCEIGSGQGGILAAAAARIGHDLRFHQDLAGIDRVLELRI